ncbi:TPA: AraC family transcriptional regulator [Escherichia coli]|nr:AraC family transcriptional regulator [Escherichia coli]
MAAVCSVIFVLSPFSFWSGTQRSFVERGTIVLVDCHSRRLFLPYSTSIIIADFDEDTVYKYLKINCVEDIRNLGGGFQKVRPDYLTLHLPEFPLIRDIISWLNDGDNSLKLLGETLSLVCLAVFSPGHNLCSFLFGCLNNTNQKARIIIHSNISACWRLNDVASRLCISGSLLKKRLKNEGVTFSRLLLEERMAMADVLLSSSQYSVSKIAGICGYASVSYFIQVFGRHFGISPSRYLASMI